MDTLSKNQKQVLEKAELVQQQDMKSTVKRMRLEQVDHDCVLSPVSVTHVRLSFMISLGNLCLLCHCVCGLLLCLWPQLATSMLDGCLLCACMHVISVVTVFV